MTLFWEKKIIRDNEVALTFNNTFEQNTIFSDQHLQKMKMCTAIVLCSGKYDISNIPKNIKTLHVGNVDILSIMPTHIQNLYYNYYYAQTVIDMQNLPTNLKKLSIAPDSLFNSVLDMLPPKLEILELNSHYSQELNNLSLGLKTLYISVHYPHQLRNLPKTIEKIIVYNVETVSTDGTTIHIEMCKYSKDLCNYRLISFNKRSGIVVLKSQK
jgi:hypothetical protein